MSERRTTPLEQRDPHDRPQESAASAETPSEASSHEPPRQPPPGHPEMLPPEGPFARPRPADPAGSSDPTTPSGGTEGTGSRAPQAGPLPPQQWGPPQGPPAGPDPSAQGGRGRWRGLRGRVAVAAVVLAGLVGGAAGAAGTYVLTQEDGGPVRSSLDTPARQAGSTPAEPGSAQAVAEQVLPSVVAITISTGRGGGNGSGIILSSDGKILTNNHVAEAGAQGGELYVTFADGSTAPASVVGLDPLTDLAVIQAEGVSDLKPATLGSSASLRVGQEVVAIGAPLGLAGTVTSGIVSALERPVNTSDEDQTQSTVIDAIQTDAAINPGNSGGALVNMAGEVVGINSAIIGSNGNIGLGFAIPIDQARPIAQQLIETGRAEHALLGVTVGNAFGPGGTGAGARIRSVEPGGAADEAGLEVGDVLIGVEDRIITDANSLVAAVRSHRPGDRVEVTYLRNGDEESVEVVLDSDA